MECNTVGGTRESLPRGWAIKVRRPAVRFNERQVTFLNKKFEQGFTGPKCTPEEASLEMRRGNWAFKKVEFLTEEQIGSYFSRLAAKRKRISEVEQIERSRQKELFRIKKRAQASDN